MSTKTQQNYKLDAQASGSLSGAREESTRLRFELVCVYAVCILTILCCGNANAQFKLDITKVADAAFPSDEDEEGDEQLSNQQQLMQQQFGINNIEQFMFNRHGNRAGAKKAVEQQLKLAIETIAKDCEISDEQREKLKLAGEMDMARMFAKFDEVRAQFKFENRNDINKLMQKVSPFQQKLQAGLFGSDSLLRRTSKTLLDPTQLELLEEKERQRLKFYFSAEMKQTIARLERQAPLRKSQREAMLKLIEDELETPLVMDKRYMRYFAMYSLAQLKPKLDDILNERQLAALKPTFQQGERMERTLKSRGMIE